MDVSVTAMQLRPLWKRVRQIGARDRRATVRAVRVWARLATEGLPAERALRLSLRLARAPATEGLDHFDAATRERFELIGSVAQARGVPVEFDGWTVSGGGVAELARVALLPVTGGDGGARLLVVAGWTEVQPITSPLPEVL